MAAPHTFGASATAGGGRLVDQFANTTTREIRRRVRALARIHPEGWKLQGHVSPATTNYLTYRIGLDEGRTGVRGGWHCRHPFNQVVPQGQPCTLNPEL